MIYPVISLSAASWRHEELLLEAAAARRGKAVQHGDNRSQVRASWSPPINARRAEGPTLLTSLRGVLRLIPTA